MRRSGSADSSGDPCAATRRDQRSDRNEHDAHASSRRPPHLRQGRRRHLVRVGRAPSRPRWRRVPRPPRRRRRRAGRRRPDDTRLRSGAARAGRVGAAGTRQRAPVPTTRSTPTCRPVRSRSRRRRSTCSRSRSRSRSPSTTAPMSTRCSACATGISICAARRCSATCGCGPRSTAGSAPRWRPRASSRSRRRCSSRRRPRAARDFVVPSRLRPGRSTRCRRARSCSSSC